MGVSWGRWENVTAKSQMGEVDDDLVIPATKDAIHTIDMNIPSDRYLCRLDLNDFA